MTTSSHFNPLGQPIGFPMLDWKPPAAPTIKTMSGRYCRLERLDPSRHADDLYQANSVDTEGRMWTYLGYGPFDSIDAYRSWLDEMAVKNDPLFYTIIDSATGRAVGLASYLRIDSANGVIEVGHLAYSPALQRCTASTEAMFLMMQHAFELGYRRYEWKCNSANEPSKAAALRLGFTFEGIHRQVSIVKGHNRDTAWFSILDSEWPALREAFERWLAPSNFTANGTQVKSLSEIR
jgi:RimJ/RimL family protein N-acetyltransferase